MWKIFSLFKLFVLLIHLTTNRSLIKAVEQSLIINLSDAESHNPNSRYYGKLAERRRTNYNDAEQFKYAERTNPRRFSFGSRFGNSEENSRPLGGQIPTKLRPLSSNSSGEFADGRQQLSSVAENFSMQSPTRDVLPNSLNELKDLLRQMDKVFTNRIESLSQRIDRLEANTQQSNFRRSTLTKWTTLHSTDKRIRVFVSYKSTWVEAKQICQKNSAELVRIETEDENRQINDLLKIEFGNITNANKLNEFNNKKGSLYWIRPSASILLPINDSLQQKYQRELEINLSSNNSHTFPNPIPLKIENTRETFSKGIYECAAISPQFDGKWFSLDCSEKHMFICQI